MAQGKGRKIGRNKKSPSMMRYKAENRCEKNKRLRAEREARKRAKLKTRITARSIRRRNQFLGIGEAA